MGRTIREVVGEAAYERVEPYIQRALAGEALAFESRLPYAEGAREVRVDYAPRHASDGSPSGFYALVRDITAARIAERAVAESEARLRFLDDLGQAVAAETSADAILATTTRMVAQHLGLSNCAYADMDADQDGFTIRGDWAAPGSPSIVGHYRLADFGRLAVQELGAGRPLIVNDNLRELAPEEAKTFQDIGIAATICMPLVKAGRLTALMAIHDRAPRVWTERELALITEVTERSWAHVERARSESELRRLNASLEARVDDEVARRTEAQAALLQSQKMETIGQLTGGVAHDFNNLLTPIVGALELTVRRAEGDERLRTLATGGLQAAERARTLVQRLLSFSRRQHLEPRVVDLQLLLDGMTDLIRRSLGPQIELDVRCEAGLFVRVDPHQLELAVLNLAVNARDAMPAGGRLDFRAWRDSRPLAGEPDWIHLAAVDTGSGMAPEVLERAVEPFFTTKQVGKGTGLGLSSVQGLALQSGGGFRLESRPGEGTTATLSFPAVDAALYRGVAPAARVQPARLDGLTILLVDDEDLVRAATASMLTGAGAAVIEASSGLSATGILGQGVRPDVLITDYAMPGMDGRVLAREARSQHPGLPVLLITGYAHLSETGPVLPRLAKPFTEADLTAAVGRVLQETTGGPSGA
ncbi:MAG: response regulator [Brevundimonas sp.]|nr:response regulator [Brevundimonas sp.]